MAVAAQEAIAEAQRKQAEAEEALAELWEALFGDEVPLDWQASVEEMRRTVAQAEQWRASFSSSLHLVRETYLGFRDELDEATAALGELWEYLGEDRRYVTPEMEQRVRAALGESAPFVPEGGEDDG